MPQFIDATASAQAELDIDVNRPGPAIRIRQKGTGPAIEIVNAAGAVLTRFHADGAVSGAAAERDQVLRDALGYTGETHPKAGNSTTQAFSSGDARANAIGLIKDDVLTNILFVASGAIQTITTLKVGVWDATGALVASSANYTTNIATGVFSLALSAPYVVPATGLYYLGVIIVATTMGSLASGGTAVSKNDAVGSHPKQSLTKSGQTDLPAALGTTVSNNSPWFGWS